MRRLTLLSLLAARTSLYASTCATLPAHITLHNGRLAPADETWLDTSRLQHALAFCGAGNMVRLIAQGSKTGFLSGPLALPNRVTLRIEKGVTLFASRDARQFQVRQGSCGVVDDKGNGCKPLFTCPLAHDAALTGAGIIDGQATAPILGETFSWYDLRQEARLTNGKVNAPPLLDHQTCRNLPTAELTLQHDPGALF